MNLYLLERTDTCDYDEYDSCVVQAESSQEARNITPDGETYDDFVKYQNWVAPNTLKVTFLGTATPVLNLPTVICASFRAA